MSALRLLATLVVAMTMLALLGLALLVTPAGSAWLVGTLADLAGDRLVLTGVRGTLLEGMAVDSLRVSAGRTTLVIEPAELQMSWPDLFRRRLRLTTARADTVRIDIAPRPPGAPHSRVEPLVLPFAISADALDVGQVVIRNGVTADVATTAQIVPVILGPLHLQGELVDGELRFESLKAGISDVRFAAGGVFGTGEPFPLQAEVRWAAPELAVSGTGRLSGDLARLRFEQVVRLPSPVGVGGVAELLQDDPQVFAEARWTELKRSFGGDPALIIASDTGRLRVRGWTDRYLAELTARGRVGSGPEVQVLAKAEGNNTREVRIPELRVDGLGGRVTGAGTVMLTGEVSGNFQLRGQRLNPRYLDRRFPGNVNFNGAVRFDGAGNFRVALPDARGTLFNRPLRASGTVARQAGVLSFGDVRIHAGVNRLDFSGRVDTGAGDAVRNRISGRFRIDAPELATLWPAFRGQLRGSGELGGTATKPTLDLDLTGNALAAGDMQVRTLRATGGVGVRQRLAIDAQAEGLRYAGNDLGNLDVAVDGRVEAHDVKAALKGGEVEVDLRGSGSYRKGIVTETLSAGRVTIATDQSWSLRDPATLRYSAPDLSLTAHCWTAGDAALCLADSRSGPRGLNGGLDLRGFPLDNLSPWLPEDIGLGGTATVAVTVQADRGPVTGALRANLSDAVITWRVPGDEDVRTEITEFRVDARLAGDVLDFDAAVAESFGLRLNARGRVNAPLGDSPTIQAEVSGGIPDLGSLGPVLERVVDVGDVQGQLTLDAKLTGNARQPDIAGGVELQDGAFTVPAAGIRVDRVSLALLGRADGQLELAGNARSGKGYVALGGTVDWRDRLLPEAEATVKGRVFDVINLPEGLVQVSPDVRVVFRDRQFRVAGEMLVPRATVRIKKIEESAVTPSPDVIVHGRDLVAAEKGPPLFVLDNLQVRLGQKVTFEGFGLKTGLTGGLRLNQSLGADPTLVTGDGVVTLRDGQFSAFGQKLAIERGSLLFTGVVTDPGLDVKASREVSYEGRDVTVGVLLSGNLSRIQTRVFSEPAMGELDALSYLTTGKPLSAAGAGDRSAVANSAISLGLTQALPVVQQLGSALSVDEVALDTTTEGDTAVVVGEQLGKNLFIRYSYGIFDKLGTVRATYKLGRRVSIEGSSGQEQALDLIYSVNW